MVLNDLFENVPNHGILLLDEFFRLLDRSAMPTLFQAVIDKGLEELERHLLWKTALMQLQLRTDDDHRAAGVVDALTKKVLAESTLLAFEGVGERFKRAIVGAPENAA